MKILGIDCGYGLTGWGTVQVENGKLKMEGVSCIETSKELPIWERLELLYNELKEIIRKEKPDCLVFETLFFFRNQKTVTAVGQAQGVIMLVAQQAKLPIFFYSPLQVKLEVGGYGRAEKKQIQEEVTKILHLKKLPKPDDAADALAVAICHARKNHGAKRLPAAIKNAIKVKKQKERKSAPTST